MKDYVITQIYHGEYNLLVLCLTHESIFTFYDDLIADPKFADSRGILLIDQLLATGNEENRYIAIPYDHNMLKFSEAKKVDVDSHIRQLSTDLLFDNSFILNNSILTDEQKECVYQKFAF